MSIYKYDNVKYDINEKNDYLQYFKSAKTIPSKSTETFRTAKQLGFCDKLLYKIKILNGIKHNVDDYKYTSLIVIYVKETYKDSDGNQYIIPKLINLGGYVEEKNQSVEVKHLSNMLGTQLISIEGKIINNSNFSITVQDLSLYKAMSYANSYMEGDLSELPNEQVITDAEDIGDGLWHEVWVDGNDNIQKFGELKIWNTSSKWLIKFFEAHSNKWGTWYVDKPFTVFDDKGNYLGNYESEYINLVNYSEYLIIDFDCKTEFTIDMDFYSTRFCKIIYINNLGRKYSGNAEKYHFKFIDSIQADYIDIHENGGECFELFDNSDTNDITEYYKYDNSEGAGIVTLQLLVGDGDDGFVHYYYCSTQPFIGGMESYQLSAGRNVGNPILINGHIVWVMEQWTYGSTILGEHIPITKVTDVERTIKYDYEQMQEKSINEQVLYFFGEALEKITELGEALEDKYPDGNKEG